MSVLLKLSAFLNDICLCFIVFSWRFSLWPYIVFHEPVFCYSALFRGDALSISKVINRCNLPTECKILRGILEFSWDVTQSVDHCVCSSQDYFTYTNVKRVLSTNNLLKIYVDSVVNWRNIFIGHLRSIWNLILPHVLFILYGALCCK